MRLLTLSIGLLLLVSQAPGQKREIKVRGKVGDTYSYRIKSIISAVGQAGAIEFSASFKEKLSKASGSELHWITTFSGVAVKSTGVFKGADQSFRDMNGMTMTFVQDSRGRHVKTIYKGKDITSRGSASVVLPNGPVAVGAKWPATIDLSGKSMNIVYTLAGYQKSGGKTLAKIVGSFPKNSIGTAIQPTVFLVDVANGKMIKGSAKTKIAMTADLQATVWYVIDRVAK